MGSNPWYKRKYEKELIWSRQQSPGAFPFVLILDHLKPTFNIGKIFRTAHAFGCREIHLIGITAFDPNPAKGALRKTRTRNFPDFRGSHDSLVAEGYSIFALDTKGSDVLGKTSFPEKTAFVMGHEEYGLSFNPDDFPAVKRLRIRQVGNLDSLNVSIAASLACYDYLRQMDFPALDSGPAEWAVSEPEITDAFLDVEL